MRTAQSKRTDWRAFALAGALLLPCAPAWARFEPPPPCKNAFTHDQEITEGAKVAAEVYKQMPVLPESDPLSRYVAQLGAKLAAKTPGGAAGWPYSFHVVASPEINAFALPGGAMFVNIGAIQAADTEAQLAGVMAHELSHVVLRHATCNITKQQKKSLWYGLGAIGSAILLGNGAAGSAAVQGIGLAQGMDFLHMSRDDERQADLLGTNLLYSAGYDPRGLAQIFEIIQTKVGASGSEWFSDHPNPGNRTQYVMQEIATLPPRPTPIVTTPAFKDAKARAQSARTFTAEETKAWSLEARQLRRRRWSERRLDRYGFDQCAASASGPAASVNNGAAQYLSDATLGLDSGLATYRGPGFAMDVPGNWAAASSQSDGSVTIAPAGGAGSFGIAYGVMVGSVRGNSSQAMDSAALLSATRSLVERFTSGDGALQQAGQIQLTRFGEQRGYAVALRGQSPILENGRNAAEHDWLVTLARPDGGISYAVFVAPERDWNKLLPVFRQMADGFRPVELPQQTQ